MWTLAWKFVTPAILVSISVLAWVNHEPMKYDNYEFPAIVEAFGWALELLPLFIVFFYPLIPLYKAWKEGFRGEELYDELFKPTDVWYNNTQKDSKQAQLNQAYDNNDQIDDKDQPPTYDRCEIIQKDIDKAEHEKTNFKINRNCLGNNLVHFYACLLYS